MIVLQICVLLLYHGANLHKHVCMCYYGDGRWRDVYCEENARYPRHATTCGEVWWPHLLSIIILACQSNWCQSWTSILCVILSCSLSSQNAPPRSHFRPPTSSPSLRLHPVTEPSVSNGVVVKDSLSSLASYSPEKEVAEEKARLSSNSGDSTPLSSRGSFGQNAYHRWERTAFLETKPLPT